jgi:hypothetical protein
MRHDAVQRTTFTNMHDRVGVSLPHTHHPWLACQHRSEVTPATEGPLHYWGSAGVPTRNVRLKLLRNIHQFRTVQVLHQWQIGIHLNASHQCKLAPPTDPVTLSTTRSSAGVHASCQLSHLTQFALSPKHHPQSPPSLTVNRAKGGVQASLGLPNT